MAFNFVITDSNHSKSPRRCARREITTLLYLSAVTAQLSPTDRPNQRSNFLCVFGSVKNPNLDISLRGIGILRVAIPAQRPFIRTETRSESFEPFALLRNICTEPVTPAFD